jgi:hypothetical protein
MHPSRRFVCILALSLTLLSAVYHSAAQTQTVAPSAAPAATVSTIPIAVSPTTIRPANGKLPPSMTVSVLEANCDGQTGTDLTPYKVKFTGVGLNVSSQSPKKCKIMVDLEVDPNAAGPYTIFLYDKDNKQVGSADIVVLDSSAGPIPPGAGPEVDVFWEVMSQNNCSDVFGKRVAQSLYCVQLKIGNNSGHPIQVAGIGFMNHLKVLTAVGSAEVTLANSSYASTRAVLLQSQVWSNRNLIANSIQGAGLIMGGFIPFYSGSHSPNAKLHFTTATAIVSGVALQAYNLIVPDPIIAQLKNLDDQSFRDNMVIQNNSHTQTVVFVEKQAVTTALRELNIQMNDAATVAQKQADAAKIKADLSKTAADAADERRALATAKILNEMTAHAKETVKNSTRPAWNPLSKGKGKPNPLLVKLALGNVVIVGDMIEYLQRMQIQSNAAPSAASPLIASPSSLVFPDQMVAQPSSPQTVMFTNTGSSPITNLNLELAGANKSEFVIPPGGNTCAATLALGTSCNASLTFTPSPSQSVPAGRSATLDVSYGPASSPLVIPLSGSAKTPTTPTVVFSQTALPFGTQKAGSGQSTASLTIVNLMGAVLTNLAIPSPTGTNAADFATPPDNKCTNALAVGDNCSVTWTFKPAPGAPGPRTATVSVTYQVTGVAAPVAQAVILNGTAQ